LEIRVGEKEKMRENERENMGKYSVNRPYCEGSITSYIRSNNL